MQRTNHSD